MHLHLKRTKHAKCPLLRKWSWVCTTSYQDNNFSTRHPRHCPCQDTWSRWDFVQMRNGMCETSYNASTLTIHTKKNGRSPASRVRWPQNTKSTFYEKGIDLFVTRWIAPSIIVSKSYRTKLIEAINKCYPQPTHTIHERKKTSTLRVHGPSPSIISISKESSGTCSISPWNPNESWVFDNQWLEIYLLTKLFPNKFKIGKEKDKSMGASTLNK